MSTSPSPALAALPAPAVFPPIPQRPSPSSPSVSAAAHAAGYAAGWAQGVAAAAATERAALQQVADDAEAERERSRALVAGALAALEAATARMRERVVPAVDALADTVAAAAIDLAEVVVGHEVADGADGADGAHRGRAALDRALAAAPEHEDVAVRLHPADLAVLTDLHAGPGSADLAGRRAVRLVADPVVAPGDAVADFAGGSVDARIATALGRMRASLRSTARGQERA